MTKYEVLNQLNQKELNSKEAYKLLYQSPKERKPQRAGFIKMRISIPESKGATAFLSFLFFLPMPLFLVKLLIPRKIKYGTEPVSEQLPMTFNELLNLVSMRGIKIDITTHDHVRIFIKTL